MPTWIHDDTDSESVAVWVGYHTAEYEGLHSAVLSTSRDDAMQRLADAHEIPEPEWDKNTQTEHECWNVRHHDKLSGDAQLIVRKVPLHDTKGVSLPECELPEQSYPP